MKPISLLLIMTVLTAAITFAEIPEPTSTPLGMELVSVGDPGNHGDTTPECLGIGAVDKAYQIGKYEVTVAQYCAFLNAVASQQDPHMLYKEAMSRDPKVSCIIRTESSEGTGYTYSFEPKQANLPITYVSLYDAERFCNWLENGCPTSEQGEDLVSASTESGSYFIRQEGDQIFTEPNPEAHYYLPSESEWVKAAYYKGNGTNSGYWSYPAQHDFAPNNGQGDESNQANYKTVATLWYSREKEPVLTPVDHFSQSVGFYGTCDMGGNVNEWTSSFDTSSKAILRGGSWQSEYSIWYNNDLMRTAPTKSYHASTANNTTGFRIAAMMTEPTPAEIVPSNDLPSTPTTRIEAAIATATSLWAMLRGFFPCVWCLLTWLGIIGVTTGTGWTLTRILFALGAELSMIALVLTTIIGLCYLSSYLPLSAIKDDCIQVLYAIRNLL